MSHAFSFSVVTHRKVQGQAEADGMGRREFPLGMVARVLVGFEGLCRRVFSLLAAFELGQGSVVVALHLIVEYLALLTVGPRDQLDLDDCQNL